LTDRLCGDHRGVDVFELCIAVGITAAFQGLAVHLSAVFQHAQQFWDAALLDLVPHLAQRRRQFRVTLRHPQKRTHRIPSLACSLADRRGLNQQAQVFQKSWVFPGQGRAPAARPANLTGQRTGVG
jgi:hypothetical protein